MRKMTEGDGMKSNELTTKLFKSENIAKLITEKPGQIIAVMMVLTLVFSAGLINFTMSMDLEDMFPDSQEGDDLELIQKEFFNDEMATIVTKHVSVLSPVYFQETANIIEAWLNDSKIFNALAMDPTTAIMCIPLTLTSYDLQLQGNLFPTMDQILDQMRNYTEESAIRSLALNYVSDESIPQLFRDYFWVLVPTDTAVDLDPAPTTSAIFLYLNGSIDDEELESIELDIEQIAKDETKKVDTYFYSEGLLVYYMIEAEKEMEPVFLLLIVALFGVLLYNFRRTSDPLITMASLLLAILWMIGIISWMGIALDMMQFMVPLMLMGLGVDFSLHLLMTYREGLGTKDTKESKGKQLSGDERIQHAVNNVFKVCVPAIALATITTMVGFASNVISDYPTIAKFGLAATIGIFAVFVVNIFFVLPWRVLKDRRSEKELEKGAIFVDRINLEPGTLVEAGGKTLPFAAIILAILLLLAVPGLVIVPTLDGEYDPRGELLEDQDLTVAATTLMDDFSMGTETLFIRVVDNWSTASAWTNVYAALDSLNDSKYVNHVNDAMVVEWVGSIFPVYSMLDPFIGSLWANITDDGITISQSASTFNLTIFLDMFYTTFPETSRFLHRNFDGTVDTYDAILISVASKTSFGKDGVALDEDVHTAFDGKFDSVHVTGQPIIWGKGIEDMADSMISSIIIVVVFAFSLLIILYSYRRKDPLLGFITGVPPMFVLGWLFLTMYLTNIPLNLMTSIVGAITVGMGIDYPVHIVNRWVYEKDQGHSLKEVYNITMGSTGKEIVFSGLTTVLAFGSFILLPMPAMRLFGLVMFISILYAMIGALVLTPLMLKFWSERSENKGERKVEREE